MPNPSASTPDPQHGGLSDHARGLLAALVVVTVWTGFNIVSRFGATASLTAYDIAALRFSVSGLIALPFFLRWVPVAEWPRHLVVALFAGIGYSLFVFTGFERAPTAHAGVFVNGGIPFWTVILVALLGGFYFTRNVTMALTMTTAGLVLIAWHSFSDIGASDVWKGDLLFLAGAFCWAVFGMLTRHWKIPPRKAIIGIASFSLVLYMPVYLLWLPKTITAAPWPEIALQAGYQGIITALLAGWMYTYACQNIGVYRASMMLAIVPGSSAIAALLILSEPLSTTTMVGLVLVSIGALLSARR